MMAELMGAVAFLTRLPVPVPVQVQGRALPLYRLCAWFPAAGLVVGAVAGGGYWLASWAGLPPAAAAWVAVMVEMLATGAMHPDGLADVADGLGGTTPARRLEIMKDSRIGSYGGVALLLTLGGRGILLAALPPEQALADLLLAHAVCRWTPVWTLARYPYARPGGGTGAAFAAAGWREVWWAGATALAAAWLLAGLPGLAAAVAAGVVGGMATAYLARKLGGVTGDVCGAVTEISLLAALAALAVRLPW